MNPKKIPLFPTTLSGTYVFMELGCLTRAVSPSSLSIQKLGLQEELVVVVSNYY